MSTPTRTVTAIIVGILIVIGGIYIAQRQGSSIFFGNAGEAGEKAARALAEELSITPEQVFVVGVSPMDWPDGCLGIKREGEFCTQAVTPGFLVILKAQDREYRYRTNKDATVIRQAP